MQEAQALETFESHREPLQEKLHPASPARHLLLQETQREVQAVM